MLTWNDITTHEPPTAARLDNPGITSHNLVLVTNNLHARDAMGRMSHVWLAMPFRLASAAKIEENGGEWIGDLNKGGGTVSCVTHWADPFVEPATTSTPDLEDLIKSLEGACAQAAGAINSQALRGMKHSGGALGDLYRDLETLLGHVNLARMEVIGSRYATHKHLKRGTSYTELGRGTLQCDTPAADMSELVVYRGESGELWFRPVAEFDDRGRFERVRNV